MGSRLVGGWVGRSVDTGPYRLEPTTGIIAVAFYRLAVAS